MLLKKITLHNFRQFIGTQSIVFSTDPEKNVTVILGENGAGKTTLAQAFTWCLYGDTDFDDKIVLNKRVIQNMSPSSKDKVKVELELRHMNIDYTMVREQTFSTDMDGKLKRPDNTIFKILYKKADGQQDIMNETQSELRMKEILPKELSKYFFFDGERIGNMSKEIKKGKSQEFAEAVKSLLGLSAFVAALDHLNGRSSVSVIKSYDNDYDSKNDSKVEKYKQDIVRYDERLETIDKRLDVIDNEIFVAEEKVKEYESKIAENKDSEELANKRRSIQSKISGLGARRIQNTSGILDIFNKRGSMWISSKMISDSLEELASADKLDKGIPDIHARTIEYLIKRKKCICGASIEFGNEAYAELNKVLDYIPPKSIGTIIGQFSRECELKTSAAEDLFDEISGKYSDLREIDNDYEDLTQELEAINKKLEGMQDVGELQKKYSYYSGELRNLRNELKRLLEEKGSITTNRDRCETSINELVLKDDNNRKIAKYKAYATYMYKYLYNIYSEKETQTRVTLEKTINEIFKEIYDGGLSIKLDEKYNIQVNVEDLNDYVETSTAQSISVIFAFIAGVIKMARENNSDENSMLVTESYPLVMDAPLSAFDKKRIKTVCDALPRVAEQVVIFIKDTDGEIAEKNMGSKVGMKCFFKKLNEFETELSGR